MSTRRRLLVAGVALVAMIVPLAASAAPPAGEPGNPELLAALPGGAGSGSAVGPGGSLYVTQPATGEIWRVDPESGEKTLYASGLPQRFSQLPFGGVMDVAFIGSTAYALVSVVGSVFPDDLFTCHPQTVGIYRVNGPTSSTVVADIGMFACENPPSGFPFVVPMGVQYALGDVSRRIPRDRRTPQPRASRHAGRHDHASDPIRRRRPDGARSTRKHDPSRGGRPGAA